MPTSAALAGLTKWMDRDEWRDLWVDVLWQHVGPACCQAGIAFEEIVGILGEHQFMTLWGCAFEDFLTQPRDSDDRTIVDDYLKRRGWKEAVPNKRYMEAIGHSLMSLYEVSEVVPGDYFLARDLVRGGDPIRISERSATRALKIWDRIGARVVEYGGKTIIAGGVLAFSHTAADDVLEALDKTVKRTRRKIRQVFKQENRPVDADGVRKAADLLVLMASAPVFTDIWLDDVLQRVLNPKLPKLINRDGSEVVFCKTRYPWAAGTTADTLRDRLRQVPDLIEADDCFWNWLGPAAAEPPESEDASARAVAVSNAHLSDVTFEDGELVLGNVEITGKTILLSTNSLARADRGRTILAACLGDLVEPPLTEIQTVEQMIADRAGQPAETASLGLPPEVQIDRPRRGGDALPRDARPASPHAGRRLAARSGPVRQREREAGRLAEISRESEPAPPWSGRSPGVLRFFLDVGRTRHPRSTALNVVYRSPGAGRDVPRSIRSWSRPHPAARRRRRRR